MTTLPDRYASGFALWKAEHPSSRAMEWLTRLSYTNLFGKGTCVACQQRVLTVDGPDLFRDAHVNRCPAIALLRDRAARVRLLAALPAIDADAEEWLRALPQQDQDVVVVARAQVAA